MSTGHGVASAMHEQPTSIVATYTPESSSASLHGLPTERNNSMVGLLCNLRILYFLFSRFLLITNLWFSTSVKVIKNLVKI